MAKKKNKKKAKKFIACPQPMFVNWAKIFAEEDALKKGVQNA